MFLRVISPGSFYFFKIVAARKFNFMYEVYIRGSSVFYDSDAAGGS